MADHRGHPKLGSFWEDFCLEQIIGELFTRDSFFLATHAGAELGLFISVAGKRYAFEFKHADAPRSCRSMHIVIDDLGLEHLWIVYPGRHEYNIDDNISAVPVESIPSLFIFQHVFTKF